ncbi:MAG: radical SAM protein [Actinobacteria bacterium]|jgi:hypothetical protein|uniref:Unannotated protein n=1 Tax=freshwater metagenome TaxID=449393 RepID=A0A6J6CK84_9ZZZZ|nr:radical SAM protein [Actinomycetota bacterium]
MRMSDILQWRATPAAGLYLHVTRRCPLSCGHCSMRSTMHLAETDPAPLRSLVDSFTADDHPRFVCLTGGEPLLRPGLVRSLSSTAKRAGSYVVMATGGFFISKPTVPPAIDDALRTIDHVVLSMDAFHEPEVPRHLSIEFLRTVLDRGQGASVQLVGTGPADPYVVATIEDLRRAFGDQVAILVGTLVPVGRGADLGTVRLVERDDDPSATVAAQGCPMLSWPVVTDDGSVVACCDQHVVDGAAAPHLRIGAAAQLTWPEIRAFVEQRPMSRAIRVFGPRYLAAKGAPELLQPGACSTCHAVGGHDGVDAAAAELVSSPTLSLIEGVVQRDAITRLPNGVPELAHLAFAGTAVAAPRRRG